MERRFTSNSQGGNAAVRTATADGNKISGYASVFYNGTPGTQYQLKPSIMERIHRTAFDAAIRDRHDTRALLNHDANYVLGRTASGTLKLSVDAQGLRYEITLPASRSDVYESVRRGDLSASSFGFNVLDENWRREGRYEIREITSVELLDISVVAFPAYKSATVDVSVARSAFKSREAIKRRFRFMQIQQQQEAVR